MNLGIHGQTMFGDQLVQSYAKRQGYERKAMINWGFVSKELAAADKVADVYGKQRVLNLPSAFVTWLQTLPEAGKAAMSTCQSFCSAH